MNFRCACIDLFSSCITAYFTIRFVRAQLPAAIVIIVQLGFFVIAGDR